jgi:hypothetical protein
LARASLRQVHPALVRRGGRWVRVASSSVRLRPVAWRELRRGAAARPCFRRAEARWSEQPLAVLPAAVMSGPAWSWAPAVAWRQPVEAAAAQARASPSEMKAAVEEAAAAQPVASARSGLLPAEEVAGASDATVQPRAVAAVRPGPSAQRPGAAEVEEAVSGAQAQPPAAVAGQDAEPRQAEVAAVQPGAAEEQQPGVVAAAQQDVEERQPAAVARRAPSVLPRAAAHPSAAAGLPPWPCRRPWLAPRQAERSAHAMRRSRTASPSRQLWRAAGCGAWS